MPIAPAPAARHCTPGRAATAWKIEVRMADGHLPEVRLGRRGQRLYRRWQGLSALLILTHPCLRRLLWESPPPAPHRLDLCPHEASRVLLAAAAVHLALRRGASPPRCEP